MPRIQYVPKKFASSSVALIVQAVEIIEEYAAQGFDLTLRQLYYQFVARGFIANKQSAYKQLGSIISDARLAGHIDWDTIVDRTRNVRSLAHWENPAEIVSSCAKQYRIDRWETQLVRPEVWIEKDALVGVIEGVCEEFDVSYFSCRGYTSQSEMWGAAQRLLSYTRRGQKTHIIHLGDHDPSGIDMTRDIRDRLALFMGHEGETIEVTRIALNMEQVKKYDPPPNPTKITDSRAKKYLKKFGNSSWELDALEPAVLAALIRKELLKLQDKALWKASGVIEERGRKELSEVASQMERT